MDAARTVRELAVSKSMAGVEMRLIAGGVRELHWHESSEWAFMIYGKARITAVDEKTSDRPEWIMFFPKDHVACANCLI